MKKIADLKLGDSVWLHNANVRYYVDDDGKKSNTMNYWKSWVRYQIVGESQLTWHAGYGCRMGASSVHFKIPKNGKTDKMKLPMACHHLALSLEEIELYALKERAYNLGDFIRSAPPEVLKQIADLVGYPRATIPAAFRKDIEGP